MADGAEHRLIGDGVGVGPAPGRVDAVGGGVLVQRHHLLRVQHGAGDAPGEQAVLTDLHVGGHRPVGPDEAGDGGDHLGDGGRDHHDVVPGPTVALNEVEGLGVDGRLDRRGQGALDDLHQVPAADAGGHEGQVLHEGAGALGAGAHQEVGDLGDEPVGQGAGGDEAAAPHRGAQRPGRRRRQDRLVQVEVGRRSVPGGGRTGRGARRRSRWGGRCRRR